jgi:hypothetical protein
MDTARLLVAVICLSCAAAAAARSPAARMHRHLNRFNKPAVKSIEVRQLFPSVFFFSLGCVACWRSLLRLLSGRFELLAGKKCPFFGEGRDSFYSLG